LFFRWVPCRFVELPPFFFRLFFPSAIRTTQSALDVGLAFPSRFFFFCKFPVIFVLSVPFLGACPTQKTFSTNPFFPLGLYFSFRFTPPLPPFFELFYANRGDAPSSFVPLFFPPPPIFLFRHSHSFLRGSAPVTPNTYWARFKPFFLFLILLFLCCP